MAATLGCLVRPTPPYTPHRKGKVERLHRTICQEFICGMPFYTDGPRAVDGRLYGPDAEPITLARFVDDFHRWVRDYNCSRSHQALGGQTPLTRWCADPTPIEEVPAEELRGLLLADVERTIAKDGIHFHNLTFVAPELNGWVGERVTVHYMPHDDRQIEVKIAGRWFTAKPQGRLSAAEQDRILARRREDADELARRQRRASRRARLRLAPITGPGPIEETTVVSRQQAASEHTSRTDRDLRRLARADLLDLAAGWTERDERGPQKLGTRKATATSLRAPGARARRPQRRTTTPVPRSDRTSPPARRRREEEAEN